MNTYVGYQQKLNENLRQMDEIRKECEEFLRKPWKPKRTIITFDEPKADTAPKIMYEDKEAIAQAKLDNVLCFRESNKDEQAYTEILKFYKQKNPKDHEQFL